MAILLPRKPTLICMAVLGPICMVDGIVKKDIKEILAMLAVFIFAIVNLLNDRKKNWPVKMTRNVATLSTQTTPNRGICSAECCGPGTRKF